MGDTLQETVIAVAEDERWMDVALGLAARGLGQTWPNPSVGCVLVNGGRVQDGHLAGARVVGRGWTQPGGRPHGEMEALARAGDAARGAIAYVSLEPCAHYGKTPPCTDALIQGGVARVVTATGDPDPRVAGRGHAQLRAAGLDVVENVRKAEADFLNEGFFRRINEERPMVALKLAQTVDGRIATAAGESRWITGEPARAVTHRLRAEHDAIMIGIGTALVDTPALTCRLPGLEGRSPVRVVVDSRGLLPPSSPIAQTAREVPVWLICTDRADTRALVQLGVRPFVVPADGAGRIDVGAAMRVLAGEGITRVLVEGGARLAASVLRQDVVDRLYLFTAGRVIGGDGLSAVGHLGLEALAAAPRFRHIHEQACGPDRLNLWIRP